MRCALLVLLALVSLPVAVGCKRRAPAPRGEPGMAPVTAVSSASAPPAASSASAPGSASVEAPPLHPPALATRTLEEQKACDAKTREMDQGLASGAISLAAKSKEFAVAYFYSNRVKGEGLLAFSGYSTAAIPLGTPHGLGKGLTHPPHIIPRADQWLALWFDAEGLLYAKSGWAATMPSVERLRAVSADEGPHTAILRTAAGAVLATAPLARGATAQLGLFEFASEDGGPVKALGTSTGASNPEHPALVEVEDGFLAAWEDQREGQPKEIHLARFDATGRALGAAISLSGRGAHEPALANTKSGALVAWDEGDERLVMVRALDEHGAPRGPARPIARGTHARLVPMGERTALSFVDFMGRPSVVTLGDDGGTSPVLLVLHGKNPVVDAPALAYADDGHLGIAYVLSGGMKAVLRIVKVDGCFEP